jgi:glycosyltransferase involved in cell wall biosynthesis
MSTPDSRRVVHVSAFYPPHLGGVEVVVEAIAYQQARSGMNVAVLTTNVGAKDAPERELRYGVRITRHRACYVAHTPIAPGLLVSLLRQPRGTLVHVHVAHALVVELVRLACWLRRIPYVVHFHLDVDASGPAGRLLPAYKRWSLGPTLRRAARVIALTEGMRSFLHHRYRIPQDRIAVVRNGIDAAFYVDRPAGPQDSTPEALRLLFVGRLAVQKNVPRLLRAMSLVQADVELVLVGDGEDRARHEQLVRDLRLQRVRFVGAQTPAEVLHWMTWAQVFVLPSDKEGMPLVALEAMAVGLPVLSTDVPGSRELLRDSGMLVPATPESLAQGVDLLAADPQLRAFMADRGRRQAAEHTWPDVAAQVTKEYELSWGSS